MTIRVQLTDIEYLSEEKTTSWEPASFRGKNVLRVAEDGSKLCVVCKTELTMIFVNVDNPNSKQIKIDIYPELRQLFRKNRITQGFIKRLRDSLIGRNFLISDGKIVDLDFIVNDFRMAS